MKMNNLMSRNNKQLIGVIIIIAAIVGSAAYGSGLMAGFDVGGEGARLYLNGISYNGVKYLSEDALLTGLPGSEKFKWQDDEISVDVDGGLKVLNPVWVQGKMAPIETSDVGGWMPDTTFKFITNPQLVDLNGNPMAEGSYTDKLISDDRDMYVYHYKVKLQVALNPGMITSETLEDQGIVQTAGEGLTFMRLIDGSVVGFHDLAEVGILKNIYALISVDLPDVEGWTYGWEADVEDQSWEFIWSGGGSYETGDYGDYVKDNYPEGIAPILNDYVVHFNLNEPQKPSHSNFDRISLVNVDGEIVGSIGLDSANVPGVYNSYYTWVLIFSTFHSEWLFMRPVFEYDLILKVVALAGDENGIPPPDPDPPWPGFDDLIALEIPQEILIGGGIGLGVIVVMMLWRRKGVKK